MAQVILLTNGLRTYELNQSQSHTGAKHLTDIGTGEVRIAAISELESEGMTAHVANRAQKGNGELIYWEPSPEAVSGSKIKWYTKDGIYP